VTKLLLLSDVRWRDNFINYFWANDTPKLHKNCKLGYSILRRKSCKYSVIHGQYLGVCLRWPCVWKHRINITIGIHTSTLHPFTRLTGKASKSMRVIAFAWLPNSNLLYTEFVILDTPNYKGNIAGTVLRYLTAGNLVFVFGPRVWKPLNKHDHWNPHINSQMQRHTTGENRPQL